MDVEASVGSSVSRRVVSVRYGVFVMLTVGETRIVGNMIGVLVTGVVDSVFAVVVGNSVGNKLLVEFVAALAANVYSMCSTGAEAGAAS